MVRSFSPRRNTIFVTAIAMASLLTVGCTEKTSDPWINDGQERRLAGKQERDEATAEHLRDRMRSGQAQR